MVAEPLPDLALILAGLSHRVEVGWLFSGLGWTLLFFICILHPSDGQAGASSHAGAEIEK